MLRKFVLAGLVARALAQEPRTTSAPAAAATAVPTKAPTVSLFLPMGHPDRVEASIISANLSQTAYELDCAKGANITSCQYTTPVTVTEGESTILYTNTFMGDDRSKTAVPLTIECELVGAHVDETPIHGATSAVCTAKSQISGLGLAASTSTLASTEIQYVPVTITAGVEKLAAATATTASATSTARAEGPPIGNTMLKAGTHGALVMAILGLL